jgi:putative ABC transport system permease protein
MVRFQFDKVMLSDFTLSFRSEVDGGALLEARRLPGVLRAEPLLYIAGTFENANHRHKGAIIGVMPDATMTILRNADGSRITMPERGLLMANRLAAQLHLTVGDRVRLIPSQGTRQPLELPVAGLVDSMFGLVVYAEYNWLNALVDEASAISSIQLATAHSPSERTAFFDDLKQMPTLLSLQDAAQERDSLWQMLVSQLGGMSYLMILFGAVIFFGAILNAALIGLIERRREMATYRVLGYRPGEVGAMYLRERLVLNLIGILLGLPLGWWMLVGMSSQYANDLYVMPSVITTSGWIWSISLAIAFVLIAQILIQRQIDRMHWNEALSMKE